MINYIITTLTIRDLRVFSIGIKYIEKYIDYEEIFLSVPDKDYLIIKEHFKEMKINILKDSDLISQEEFNTIKITLAKMDMAEMYGWYVQQFVKIKFIAMQNADKLCLIWDADTVPLRPLNFISNNGGLNYFVGYEYNEPYFTTIENLLSIKKLTPYSFISQCFPVYSKSVHLLISQIGNGNWIHFIMNNLASGSKNLFSEYETLGNFLLHQKSSRVNFIHSPWMRDGIFYYYIYGSIEKAISNLKYKYSYVAFEKINVSFVKWIYLKVKKFIIKLIHIT